MLIMLVRLTVFALHYCKLGEKIAADRVSRFFNEETKLFLSLCVGVGVGVSTTWWFFFSGSANCSGGNKHAPRQLVGETYCTHNVRQHHDASIQCYTERFFAIDFINHIVAGCPLSFIYQETNFQAFTGSGFSNAMLLFFLLSMTEKWKPSCARALVRQTCNLKMSPLELWWAFFTIS